MSDLDQTPSPVSVGLAVSRTVSPTSQRVPASRTWGKRRIVVGLVVAAFSGIGLERVTAPTVHPVVTAATTPALRERPEPPAPPPVVRATVPLVEAVDERVDDSPDDELPADARVEREGYGHIPGGVVFVPETFSSKDGTYDLYVHFHGNTRVVLESAEYSGLNAVVAVVNLGVNSAPYLDAYETPGAFARTLGAVDRVLAERGLETPHRGRVAIGSWSGGYGAVSKILDREGDSLDAVLVLDGIHCGYLEDSKKALNALVISPFLVGAKRAVEGELLFSITHSEIDPVAYAGAETTAGYLLAAVHGTRGAPHAVPEHVQLRAAEGAVAKKLEKRMEPISDATVGSFHVRGYRGNTPEHHMAHLFQMGATVLPELVARWRTR